MASTDFCRTNSSSSLINKVNAKKERKKGRKTMNKQGLLIEQQMKYTTADMVNID